MPILAGRVLGTGSIDLVGILLAISVLFWIPTHIVTFSIKYAKDYLQAGIPVFPNRYGERVSLLIIGVSTAGAVVAMALAAWFIGLHWGYLYALLGLSVVLLGIVITTIKRNSRKMIYILFKSASVYMLASAFVLIIGS
jgi:protoheme IX farnesyltransferase